MRRHPELSIRLGSHLLPPPAWPCTVLRHLGPGGPSVGTPGGYAGRGHAYPNQTPLLPHLSRLNRRSPSCSCPNYRRQVPNGLEREAALLPWGHCHRDAQTPSQPPLSSSAPLFSEDRPEDLTPTGVVAHLPSSPSPAGLAGCHAQVATKTWAHGWLAG